MGTWAARDRVLTYSLQSCPNSLKSCRQANAGPHDASKHLTLDLRTGDSSRKVQAGSCDVLLQALDTGFRVVFKIPPSLLYGPLDLSLCIHLSSCLSIYLSRLSIYLAIYLSIYL